jgi:hypothetical protein
MMKRYSSRRQKLGTSVLAAKLEGALSYDRIAGYFRSSLFEVAGEALLSIKGPVRIICNSDIDPQDMKTALAAQQALRQSWCRGKPELAPPEAKGRYQQLYDALIQKKIEVRVLPDKAFGLIHGKAGVIKMADGVSTSFIGSVNESKSAWEINYELLWEDDNPDSVAWVQEEFDALWNDPRAIDLSVCPFIQQDIGRIIGRTEVEPDSLRDMPPTQAAGSVAVELPVYRKEQGLWPHQKYFARLALERHRLGGARLILADQVGLGKTVQLAMAALLIAADDPDGGPILVLAPKAIMRQWQDEIWELLHLPSAIWNGKQWVDENGVEHATEGFKSLAKCPRRIGIVSQGLVVRGLPETINPLLGQNYACVIVDEAHRARRRNLPKVDADSAEIDERSDANKLMAFLFQIALRTKSMLLASATPVQLHPVEAWDLLNVLSRGNDGVLGGQTLTSPWYQPSHCLDVSTGRAIIPLDNPRASWSYISDPLPSRYENDAVRKIRDVLEAPNSVWQFTPEALDKLPKVMRNVTIQGDLVPNYGIKFNPLLRCIIRRTRGFLETTINPFTKEYYLPKVTVKLFGEAADDAVVLDGYLLEAYQEAEHFSKLLQQRVRGAGFFKTILLRRLGSSIEAGRVTISKLLGEGPGSCRSVDDEDEDEHEDDFAKGLSGASDEFTNYTAEEVASLSRCLQLLKQGGDRDPKLEAILDYLLGRSNAGERWMDLGCILFSQYYATVRWIGDQLAMLPEFSGVDIGLYAGDGKSGLWRDGQFRKQDRESLKLAVRRGELKVLLGTDAASEGLNLQRLGSLINVDLPWNPTKLEQRKGRIQRIGQVRSEVWVANLRYRGSVEDKVHKALADRLEAIHGLFGQIPDTLEDVWVQVALNDEAAARRLINSASETRNPFDIKYNKVEDDDWESVTTVLRPEAIRRILKRGWKD